MSEHANIFDVLIAWTPIISILASALVAVCVPWALSRMSKKIDKVKAEVVAEVVGVIGTVKEDQAHLLEKVEQVHKTTNGKMDALLKATEGNAFGKGQQTEREQQAARESLVAQGAVTAQQGVIKEAAVAAAAVLATAADKATGVVPVKTRTEEEERKDG